MEYKRNENGIVKLNFIEKLLKLDKKENHYSVMTKTVYEEFIKEVEEAKVATKRTSLQYRRLKRFNVVEIDGVKKLVSNGEPLKSYLPVEEIFDVIEYVHLAVGHGGRDRIRGETSMEYANITTEMINIFLSMCETCQQKKSKVKKDVITKPEVHPALISRCQVNLVDMQSHSDYGNNFIMVYQDYLTKFVILRALTSNRSQEVAQQLTDIFLTFGAPCILDSNDGQEFVSGVLVELNALWPELKIVPGKPQERSQISLERANQDFKNMLTAWMKDNQSVNWSKGLQHVQFLKNTTFNSGLGIKSTPYKAMFGRDCKMGLATSKLPNEAISNIFSEEELENYIEQVNKLEKKAEQNGATEILDSEETHDNLLEKSPE